MIFHGFLVIFLEFPPIVLKIVEIIGEDDVTNLDPETIYFISHLLNQNGLKEIRNKILISSLPLRV